MHILIVISHPRPDSLTHALSQRFAEGAQAAGHTVEFADLHAEGFDPRWQAEDEPQFDDGPSPADILAEQARIERCDALCLAFPLYWFGMPALMKGWVDRVFTWNWAYDQVDDPNVSLLRDRIGVMLVPAAANTEKWTNDSLGTVVQRIWDEGTMRYFGFKDQRIHVLGGSEGSQARREGLLERAYQAGRALPS